MIATPKDLPKRVLIVAFHFSPAVGSSGVHRANSMARYASDYGWQPLILTVPPFAHPKVSAGSSEKFSGAIVRRAFAIDTSRHLSVFGKYPGILALPDNWISWWPFAIRHGMKMAREFQPNILWSTYPIATSHLVANSLARRLRIPWVADFRDSMVDDTYPGAGIRRRIFKRIERSAISQATAAVFTAPGTRQIYSMRYPNIAQRKWKVVYNGYDEDAFDSASRIDFPCLTGDKVVILHSGVIYPHERNPIFLFEALAQLQDNGAISKKSFELRLRSTGHDDIIRSMINKFHLDGLVTVKKAIPYHDALAEMLKVNALMILQASNCNHQIPAKLFEYARAGKPIIALTDKRGDTAKMLGELGGARVASLNSPGEIATTLIDSISRLDDLVKERCWESVQSYSRRGQVRKTLDLFDDLVSETN